MAYEYHKFSIYGEWVEPLEPNDFTVTEQSAGVIYLGSAKDVGRAVAAARRAFDASSCRCREERRVLLQRILAIYKNRHAEIAAAITTEMGAPVQLAKGRRQAQAANDAPRVSPEATSCGPPSSSAVDNDMTIGRGQIFGLVLAILPYRDEEEAIRIANDTPYGLPVSRVRMGSGAESVRDG